MMKINVNTAGLMMDCMSYAFVAAVTKERGTAPSDEEIHSAVKSLMALYCRHEGISVPIDEVPSEYTGIPDYPYPSPDEDKDEKEDNWNDEEENEDDWDEEDKDEDETIISFINALNDLMDEYDFAFNEYYQNFVNNLKQR